MEPPKYRAGTVSLEKVLIGLESAPPSFDVRGKVLGPGGANLQYITNETGAIVTMRGRGSGFIEPNTGQESIEPLHLCVEHSKYEVLQAGRQLAFNLIETVQQEWSNFQQQQLQGTSSQNQAVSTMVSNIQLQSPQLAAVDNSLGLPVYSHQAVGQMLSVPPPDLAVPPPSMHMPQPPLQVSGQGLVQGSGEMVPSSVSQHTLPLGHQQVYVSQQGNTLIQSQAATVIQAPQQTQQVIPQGSMIAQQPQILTQTTYPIQYGASNTGQMVVAAYPQVVRGENGQVMLVQYAGARPPIQRTVAQPQLVQIIHPQTGQLHHVIHHPQHQQHQIHMSQVQQIVPSGAVGQQIVMPVQQSLPYTAGQQQQQMMVAQSSAQQMQGQGLQQQLQQNIQQLMTTQTQQMAKGIGKEPTTQMNHCDNQLQVFNRDKLQDEWREDGSPQNERRDHKEDIKRGRPSSSGSANSQTNKHVSVQSQQLGGNGGPSPVYSGNGGVYKVQQVGFNGSGGGYFNPQTQHYPPQYYQQQQYPPQGYNPWVLPQ